MSEDTTWHPHHTEADATPGFAKIAKSLWGDDSPHITIDVPQEQAQPWVVGSSVVMSRMVQDMLGTKAIGMMTCQLNVVGLGSAQPSSTITTIQMPTETPTLEDALESED